MEGPLHGGLHAMPLEEVPEWEWRVVTVRFLLPILLYVDSKTQNEVSRMASNDYR